MAMIPDFYVFTGFLWLADDEHSWTPNFTDAACFTSIEAAQRIAERERLGDAAIYIMQVVD